MAPRRGEPAGNAAIIAGMVPPEADLVLTPELSLTGYDLRDGVHEAGVSLEDRDTLPGLFSAFAGQRSAIALGVVEHGRDGIPYNAAAVVGAGRLLHTHRKVYLPTYGLFDEGRYFGRGERVECVVLPGGWRVAVLVCEDLWHPALPYLAALDGAHLLAVMAAAPGRGAVEGGPGGATFASTAAWDELVRVTARTHGIYVALCNRTGVEDGVTFAGRSLIVGPDGAVLAQSPAEGEHRLDAVLSLAELARARRPFAHARDEDVSILLRGLSRLSTR